MISDQWYIVLASRQVRDKPIGVTRMGEKLVFWRDPEGALSCLRDRCVHRGVALSEGRVVSSGRLQCPFHGFEYDLSGRVTKIPANGQNAPVPERFRVHSYPTYEAQGLVTTRTRFSTCAFTRNSCPCPYWASWSPSWVCPLTCASRTRTAAWW